MEFADEMLLALLIIRKGDIFANSYGLNKMLARSFGIINYLEILGVLRAKGYIKSEDIDGMGHYWLTNDGEEYLKKNYIEIIVKLRRNFPKEESIIAQL